MQKMLGKKVGESKKKPKGNKKPGRPRRDRIYSLPSPISEEYLIADQDRIAEDIGCKIKRKINEVGSPGKAEVTLEEKKMKKDGEWTEKKEDGKKKVEEEDTHLSPLKRIFSPLKRIFSSEEKGKTEGKRRRK